MLMIIILIFSNTIQIFMNQENQEKLHSNQCVICNTHFYFIVMLINADK